MKAFRIVAVILAGFGMALASVHAAAQSAEESAVRAVVQKEIDGWQKYDSAQIASCYATDIIWQNPFGVRILTREKLEKFLTNLFARPGYRSAKDTTPPRITDVRILSPTSAVVWSEEKTEGQIDDDTGKPMKPRYSHYMETLVKKNGAWLITDSIIMDEYPQP